MLESFVTSPPNLWWEQRRLWRDKWKQFGTSEEGQTTFPYDGRPPPGWNRRCVKEPGLLNADWGRPKLWWEWLEGPPDLMDWKSGLKSAAKSTAGDFMSQFFDSDKCTLPIKLDTPISKYWQESGQAGFCVKVVEGRIEFPVPARTIRAVRFAFRFSEDEPATLDPRLPRPAGLPDLNKYTESQREDMYEDARMKAFDGNSGALGVGADMTTEPWHAKMAG
ncbi:unnamed protein product [Symbiodinium natans]|uniref:Uncharacterized protein n=1 Tax=Symbiodinium natans TaxID=878477 RepID=A0A812NGN9_9DINO|nr:unnamed protein product [Symbiodinium natans]